jgi:hypothetical protein
MPCRKFVPYATHPRFYESGCGLAAICALVNYYIKTSCRAVVIATEHEYTVVGGLKYFPHVAAKCPGILHSLYGFYERLQSFCVLKGVMHTLMVEAAVSRVLGNHPLS